MKDVSPKALIAGLALGAAVTGPALANDTSAVIGVGGLELTRSDDIAMASEDLYLSPSEVRVRYAFRNESRRDITTTVAFPLPDIDQDDFGTIVFLPADKENFVDFRVTIDGQPVQPRLEEKAIGGDGADVTEAVKAAGLPLNARLPGWREKIAALPRQAREKLVHQKLLQRDPGAESGDPSPDYFATWTLRAAFHWDQTFPAGATVAVDHRYKPIAGGVSVFADQGQLKDYKAYCLDDQGKAGLRRLLKQTAQAADADPQAPAGIAPLEVAYVLKTGANWKGPIGDFRLTIDKEKPDAILSLCLQGLRKTGPTTFELRQTDFTPKEDIRFVVFKP